MPIHLQAKLLRVLQEKKLNRLGGETSITLDVRVVAATNKDLRQAIQQREFREDLYFRISTFRLRIQPLAERPGDIVPLVLQSLARHAKEGVPYTLSAEARDMLLQYSWPGNVRELENVVQRAVVLCNGRTITPVHLMFDEASAMNSVPELAPQMPQPLSQPVSQPLPPQAAYEALPSTPMATPEMQAYAAEAVEEPTALAVNLQHAVKSSEQQIIMAALQSTESREEAARKLGISPRTLRYKLAQLRNRGMSLSFAE